MARRKTRRQRTPMDLGGWLWIPLINLLIWGILYGFNAYIYGALFFTPDWLPTDLSWLILSAAITVLVFYTLFLAVRHEREFVTWAIFTLWAVYFVDIYASMKEGVLPNLITGAIFPFIWTWYFRVSERVKKTFVK